MKISTKGRYALRVMIDLAGQAQGGHIPLNEIALRQEISEKYLEGILATLSRAGLVSAVRGKGGGYRLSRPPEDYTVGEILKAAEGSLAPVACLEAAENTCPRAGSCKTLPMWQALDRLVDDFFEQHTLADFLS